MITQPLTGARYLLTGLRLIGRPRLRPFVAVPLAINTLVFVLAITFGVGQFEHWMNLMTARIPDWLDWLEWLLWPVFVLVLLVLVFYTFTLVANLIAAPFNSLLAEKVELELTGQVPDAEGSLRKLLAELLPSLLDELVKLVYALALAIPFLLLLLVPVVGPVLWLLYTAWMMAVEYGDYPLGNHGLRFKEIRQRLGRRRLLSLGFGGAVAAMSMVPVLNFLLMPSAVAGATALWVGELRALRPEHA
ncbi:MULTISPECIES: sulfate transporter CysZ [Thiorhodovibrio]|uniref:sulfate transporter CysZ n=1 Tax=Thiorhodovibrio TaxID=61593 RepID=UPI001913BF68|nr:MULTISPECIES: sulfate transporter CysZ [Thiorhodovibrio]MBK5968974.1 sulfate transporter CysZ [Thiorhodovibrio winogradskyi]WPL10310.1 putative sulfate transport protein CysZ [Thiorhodovibrio litoralis]